MGFVASVCHPSTFRMLIWPEASSAQNNMAAVAADGSTVCVLILRLNSSCSRSISDRIVIIDPEDVDHPPALNMFDMKPARVGKYSQTIKEQIEASTNWRAS